MFERIVTPVVQIAELAHNVANPVNVTKTAITMFALTVVPIVLAMALRKSFPNAMLSAEPVVSKVAVALLA